VSRSVLLIGWRPKAVEALEKLGATVCSVVAPREGVGVPNSSRIVAADPANAEDVISAISRADREVSDYDIVASQHEFTMVTAALLGTERSWMPLDTAVALRDKYVQKRRIRSAGIPVADCELIEDLSNMALPKEGQVVIKPLAGAGARNTHVLASRQDLAFAENDYFANSIKGPWLLEQFSPGHEHSIDGVVRGGRVVKLTVSRYQSNLIEMRRGKHMLYVAQDADHETRLFDKAWLFAQAVMNALSHSEGIFHMEAFLHGESFIFSECAGRVCGGKADVMAQLKFGVDIHEEWARAVLQLPPGRGGSHDARQFAHGWLPLPAGKLLRAPGIEAILAQPGVCDAQIRVHLGEKLIDPATSSDAGLGTVVVTGDSIEDVERHFANLVAWVQANSDVESASVRGT
jgi:phosphoribosylaminoimidazole carboxylase (NCAIR synthetase)